VVDIRPILARGSNVIDVLHRAPNRAAAWRFLRGLKGARRVKYIRDALDFGADAMLEEALDEIVSETLYPEYDDA
jgi:hypothetical protein